MRFTFDSSAPSNNSSSSTVLHNDSASAIGRVSSFGSFTFSQPKVEQQSTSVPIPVGKSVFRGCQNESTIKANSSQTEKQKNPLSLSQQLSMKMDSLEINQANTEHEVPKPQKAKNTQSNSSNVYPTLPQATSKMFKRKVISPYKASKTLAYASNTHASSVAAKNDSPVQCTKESPQSHNIAPPLLKKKLIAKQLQMSNNSEQTPATLIQPSKPTASSQQSKENTVNDSQKPIKQLPKPQILKPQTTLLQGKSFAILGRKFSRSRDEIKSDIVLNGGEVTNKITSRTAYLLCMGDEYTAKYRKAQQNGVKIIKEEDFFQMIQQATRDNKDLDHTIERIVATDNLVTPTQTNKTVSRDQFMSPGTKEEVQMASILVSMALSKDDQ